MRPEDLFRFTHAIARLPGASAVHGLRARDRGPPDIARFLSEHRACMEALATAGLAVTVLDALEDFPDSCFVEDVALCLPEGAVLLRPGAVSRRGETAHMAPHLEVHFGRLQRLPPPGTVDGGDILDTGSELRVGLSRRSSPAGVAALRDLLAPWGRTVRAVPVPRGVLHLRSACAMIAPGTVLATPALAALGSLDGLRVLPTARGEDGAANCLRVNDRLIVPAGYPRTAERLAREGFDLLEVPVAEAEKLDAGLSCLSLRLRPGPG